MDDSSNCVTYNNILRRRLRKHPCFWETEFPIIFLDAERIRMRVRHGKRKKEREGGNKEGRKKRGREGWKEGGRKERREGGRKKEVSCVCVSMVRGCVCSVTSDSLRPQGLQLARLLCPWNFPCKNTGVGCYFLLQGIFPTKGSNPHFLHLLHWQMGSVMTAPPGTHTQSQAQACNHIIHASCEGSINTRTDNILAVLSGSINACIFGLKSSFEIRLCFLILKKLLVGWFSFLCKMTSDTSFFSKRLMLSLQTL